MALHSTKETPALKSGCPLVLYSARWALYSTHPTQYFYSTGWVLYSTLKFLVLLQHYVGTLQHPLFEGYFTTPCYDHSMMLCSIVAIKLIPPLIILSHYKFVPLRVKSLTKFDLAMMNEVEKKYMGSLDLFPAIMR